VVDLGRDGSARVAARRHFRLRLLVVFFALGLLGSTIDAAAAAHAQSGRAASIGPSFAIADFDGDQRPDLVRVEGGRIGSSSADYWIQLQLSASGQQAIRLIGPPGGLTVEARDVNGDHAVDLVLTTSWLRQPVAVFLNDGHGGFSRAEPSEFPGAFSDSRRNWGAPPIPVLEAVGILSQPRASIWSDATGLPDVRGPTDSAPACNSAPLLNSFLGSYAGRAPPLEVSSL